MARSPLHIAAAGAALALAAPAAGTVAPEATRSATAPVATVKVTECVRSEANRSVEFRGSMRRVRGTRSMGMRFQLEEKVGDAPFANVSAPELGVWRKSRPGVSRFSYRQGVNALASGSAYRTTVQYRWYSKRGKVVRRARRLSGPCVQPGVLPNLRVARIGGKTVKGSPRLVRYSVFVANRGRAPSAPTTVSLAVDGSTVDTVPLGSLSPGQETRVFVNGPACTNTVEGRVDSADTVREASEGDNVRSVACPAAQ